MVLQPSTTNSTVIAIRVLGAAMVAVLFCGRVSATVVDSTPTLKIKTTDSRTITSASVAGKLVVIHFWSMQSRPSVKASPQIVSLQQQFKDRGVQFLGVCLDRVSDEQANFTSSKLGFTWFQAVDSGDRDDRLTRLFDIHNVPVAILISTKGRVLWKGHPAELEPQIAFGLKTHPPKAVALLDYEMAIESLQRADILSSRGKFTNALRLIETIAPAVKPDAAMKQLAQRIARQLRPTTSAKAQQIALAKTKYPDAMSRLTAMQEANVVTPTPTHTTNPPTHHSPSNISQAVLISRLSLAERYLRADNDIKAYDVYLWIVSKAPQSDIGQVAKKKVAAFQADPAFMSRHRVLTAKRLSEAQLAIAIELEELKQIEPAKAAYLKLIADYPRSLSAAKAKIRMEKLPK